MAWRPSDDETLQRPARNSFWDAIETIFDNRVGTNSLPRHKWGELQTAYITDRRYDGFHDVTALRSRLPIELETARMGPTEIELTDFILNYSTERVLNIEGPRGSGKTSLLRYVEEVIRSSGYVNWPVMLIVDCLAESEDTAMTEAQIARLVGEELTKASAWVPDTFQAPLAAAAAGVLSSPKFSAVRTQFIHLRKVLGHEFSRLVLVFDNLDQHLPAAIMKCMEITKQLHVATQLASLMTLRPGCLQGVQSRGGARAYFRFRTNVSAPKTRSWLEQIGIRVAAGVAEQFASGKRYRTVNSVDLTPEVITKVFKRLGQLLISGHRDQDSAVGILDSVAADDVRHLVLLVRHMLSHKDLPIDWLLSDQLSSPDYFPIAAILEGDRYLYAGQSFVPNLLCRDGSDGTHDFLVGYRVLTLLNAGVHPIQSKHLLHQLQVLGHNKNIIVATLKVLHDALLVRSTTAEKILPEGSLPDAFFITEAGEYYLHRFIINPDYLTAVIPNVPLSHDSLRANLSRRKTFSFVDRLASLRELTTRIMEQEGGQVRRLIQRSQTEDVVSIADALENGGLLCGALIDGLTSAKNRSEHSRSEAVQREGEELESFLAQATAWLAEQRHILRDTAERSRDVRAPLIADVVLTDLDTQVSIKQAPGRLRSQVQTTVEVRTIAGAKFALIALTGSKGSKPFSTATLAVRKSSSKGVLYADILDELNSSVEPVTDLKAQAIVAGLDNLGRIALLTTSDDGGDRLKLRLQLLKSDKAGTEKREIGRDTSLSDVEPTVQAIKDFVQAGTSDHDVFSDRLREQGIRLSRLVLSESGENVLASYRHLIDTLIIFVSRRAMSIPWEWMRPAPTEADPDPPSLGECYHVIRWPGEKMEDIVDAMAQLAVVGEERSVGELVTVGLPPSETTPWRRPAPRRVPELFKLGSGCSTFHVVGHVPDGIPTLEVLEGGPKLSEDSIRAYRLLAPQVILSGCEVGATREATNLAIELSTTSKVTVWAPIVKIKKSDVERLDKNLAELGAISTSPPLSRHFKEQRRSGDMLTQLYTCYGISKGGL